MTEASLPIHWTSRDGAALTMRRIGPDDFDRARTFLQTLSFGSRYFRFGRGRFVYPDEELRRICEPDPSSREHLIVVTRVDGVEVMAGSARYVVASDGRRCEFAVVVLDDWQHHGLGRRLMLALIEVARGHGLETMYGEVLGSNRTMLEFIQRLGFRHAPGSEERQIKTLVLSLQQAAG